MRKEETKEGGFSADFHSRFYKNTVESGEEDGVEEGERLNSKIRRPMSTANYQGPGTQISTPSKRGKPPKIL